jgi:hypothetical protein
VADEFHVFLLEDAAELVMRPREAATIALWASGVTPGASAFDDPSARPPRSRDVLAGVIVSGVIVSFGVVVDVLELVLVVSMMGAAVGSLVLSVFFGRDVDDVLATVWTGVSIVVVVVVLVLVATG